MKKIIALLLCLTFMLPFTAFAEETNGDVAEDITASDDGDYIYNYIMENNLRLKSLFSDFDKNEIHIHTYYADKENEEFIFNFYIEDLIGMTAPYNVQVGNYCFHLKCMSELPYVISNGDCGDIREMYIGGNVSDGLLETAASFFMGHNVDETNEYVFQKVRKYGGELFDFCDLKNSTLDTTDIRVYLVDFEKDIFIFEIAFDDCDYSNKWITEMIGGYYFDYPSTKNILYAAVGDEIGTFKEMYDSGKLPDNKTYENSLYYDTGLFWNLTRSLGKYTSFNGYRVGEFNWDDAVDVADVVILRNEIVNNSQYISSAYDINYDGNKDILDVVWMRDKIVNG